MKKVISWIVIIVIVIIGAVVLSKDGDKKAMQDETGPIKVGFIGPLTGDAAAYGEPARKIAELAVADINANGGIAGRELEVVYEDAMCDGKQSATAVQKLINTDGAKFIIGAICSSEALPAVPIAEDAGVLILSGAATSPDLTGISEYFVRFISSDAAETKALAEEIVKREWKKVGILNEQTDYAAALQRSLQERLEQKNIEVVVESFTTETTDFRTSLAKLSNSNLDVVYIVVQAPDTGENILVQMESAGWDIPLMLNDVVGSSPGIIAKHEALLEGGITTQIPSMVESEQLTAMREAYGEEVPFETYMASVYDSVYALKDAIESVGSTDATAIATWIRGIENRQGASGSFTIEESGDRSGNRLIAEITGGKVVQVEQ